METEELVMDMHYDKAPAFCMLIFDHRNSVSKKLVGNDRLIDTLMFSDNQAKEIYATFGNSALVVKNGDEFIKRVERTFLAQGITFTRGRVNYYDQNYLQHFREINENGYRIAFWKKEIFEYQQEYRIFAFETEVDDHLEVDIGDLSDITMIISKEQALDLCLEIEYSVKEKV